MQKSETIKIEDNVFQTRLENGLTIVSHQMPIQSLAVGAWVKAGSRNEEPHEHGIAHFLEHMAFKGTQNRSAKQIVEAIENVGGDMNASTGIEVTSYYFRLLNKDLDLGFEILADILLNPNFTLDEMAKERDVILSEIAASEDDPDEVLFDQFIEQAYQDQAIGRSILGTKQSVKNLGLNDLTSFLDKNYDPQNITIAMAGGADHKTIVKLAAHYFGALKAKPLAKLDQAKFVPSEVKIEKDLEQQYLLLGFEANDFNDPNYFAQQILSQILGGGMSSRLFQNIREQKGLCYSIYASSWGFNDSGLFFIYAATDGQNLDEMKTLIGQEVIAITQSISDEEFNRACNQIKASQLMSLESPVSRSEQIARQSIFYGNVISVEEIMQRLDNVTVADVQNVAKDLFVDEKGNVKPHLVMEMGR